MQVKVNESRLVQLLYDTSSQLKYFSQQPTSKFNTQQIQTLLNTILWLKPIIKAQKWNFFLNNPYNYDYQQSVHQYLNQKFKHLNNQIQTSSTVKQTIHDIQKLQSELYLKPRMVPDNEAKITKREPF